MISWCQMGIRIAPGKRRLMGDADAAAIGGERGNRRENIKRALALSFYAFSLESGGRGAEGEKKNTKRPLVPS